MAGILPRRFISFAANDIPGQHQTEPPAGYTAIYTKDDLDYVRLNLPATIS